MENQTNSPKQTMINYGLMLGFIYILINVALFAMGKIYNPPAYISLFSTAVMIVIIVLGIKQVKTQNNGFLSLGEALKMGIAIAVISAIVMVIYNLIFANFIEPQYYVRVAENAQQQIIEKYPQWSDEQVQTAVNMSKKMSGPFVTSAITIVASLFFGFIFSLIAGLIMKKTNEEVTSI